MSGLFYGWGSLVDAIDKTFSPDDYSAFVNQHGLFTGVIILMLSVMPMPLLRLLLDSKRLTEFQIQFMGMILCTVGLFFGGIALQYKNIYILYFLCAVPCGFGGLGIYQRLVFIHQLWFKKIGKQVGRVCCWPRFLRCVLLPCFVCFHYSIMCKPHPYAYSLIHMHTFAYNHALMHNIPTYPPTHT